MNSDLITAAANRDVARARHAIALDDFAKDPTEDNAFMVAYWAEDVRRWTGVIETADEWDAETILKREG